VTYMWNSFKKGTDEEWKASAAHKSDQLNLHNEKKNELNV